MRSTSEVPLTDPDGVPGESDGGRKRVSVVIPCYNAEEWVARAIRSALNQPGVEAEVIVIDDGSTDGSLEVIRSFGDRIRWKAGPNRGACAARNGGLELATAEYMMFLDADDFLEGPLLEGMVERLRETGADLVIGPLAIASIGAVPTMRELPRTYNNDVFVIDWLSGKWVTPCALGWRRNTVKNLGGWRTDLRRHQEAELALRGALRGINIEESQKGRGIYWNYNSPYRISTSVTLKDNFDATMILLRMIADEADISSKKNLNLWKSLCSVSSSVERKAAFLDNQEALTDVRKFKKEMDFPRYSGSLWHVTASFLLGLGRKERLSRWLHRLRRKIYNVSIFEKR